MMCICAFYNIIRSIALCWVHTLAAHTFPNGTRFPVKAHATRVRTHAENVRVCVCVCRVLDVRVFLLCFVGFFCCVLLICDWSGRLLRFGRTAGSQYLYSIFRGRKNLNYSRNTGFRFKDTRHGVSAYVYNLFVVVACECAVLMMSMNVGLVPPSAPLVQLQEMM